MHYCVAVIRPKEGPLSLASILAPFCGDPDLAALGGAVPEFQEDEDANFDDEAQAKGYWYNPDAHWDWWEEGGRWEGLWGYDLAPIPLADLPDPETYEPTEAEERAIRLDYESLLAKIERHGESRERKRPKSFDDFRRTHIRFRECAEPYAYVDADGSWVEGGVPFWDYVRSLPKDDYTVDVVDCHC